MESAGIPAPERQLSLYTGTSMQSSKQRMENHERFVYKEMYEYDKAALIISPILFNLYSEYMMNEFHDEVRGIIIGGKRLQQPPICG